MAEIYVLTNGNDSEYDIVGIFSSRASAERCLKAIYGDEPTGEIETFVLDPGCTELEQGLRPYHVGLHTKDGGEPSGGEDWSRGDPLEIEVTPYLDPLERQSDHLARYDVRPIWAHDAAEAVQLAQARLQRFQQGESS
jgi:hypothetical protein